MESRIKISVNFNKTICFVVVFLQLFILSEISYAQKEIQNLSKDEISQLTQEELLEMPLEDLMALVKRYKLSSLEELYEKVLNPKISTASKFDEKYFASPLSTFVINSDEIMASGALNIPEVLRLAPGLIVRQKLMAITMFTFGEMIISPADKLYSIPKTHSLW